MIGRLDIALTQLLLESLPSLLGGATPPVQSSIVSDAFVMDPNSADAEAGEPRTDDQHDLLAFNPGNAAGPYRLLKPPVAGPRRVRLATGDGDRVALSQSEVLWDATDSSLFTLSLRADRVLTGITSVEALYGITAVFVRISGTQKFGVQLKSSDLSRLAQSEALSLAVIALNRKRLCEQGAVTSSDGDYSAQILINSLTLVDTTSPAADTRRLEFSADLQVKASRALRVDEGKPIVKILSPGAATDADHPININIGVD